MIRRKEALVLLVAVCSAFSSEPGKLTAGDLRRHASQATAPLDVCALVLKADVDAAFAPRLFGPGEKGRGYFAGTAKLATVAECTFTSRGASVRELMTVSILVRRAPSDQTGVTVATAKGGAVKLNATPIDVPRLGDAAYWVNLGSSTHPIIQLNVLKGKRLWLVFSTGASQRGTDAALTGLTKVANATLGRL